MRDLLCTQSMQGRAEAWWFSCRDIPGDKLNAQCSGDHARIFPASCVCFLFSFSRAKHHTTGVDCVSVEIKKFREKKGEEHFVPSQQLLEVVLVGFAAPLNRLKLSSGDFPKRMQRKCMLELLVFLSNVM